MLCVRVFDIKYREFDILAGRFIPSADCLINKVLYYCSMLKSAWYYSLLKPSLTPPDWIFQPAWLVLYLTMLVAILLYIFKPAENKEIGYVYFTFQMVFNLLWMPAFFYMQNITLALVVIIFLDIFVFLTIKKFYSVSKLSGLILIPYFSWIFFATYLNIGYLILNA